MRLIKLSFASFLLIAAAAVFAVALGVEQSAKSRTGEWITLGGNCDAATCTTGYWSGATVKDFNEATSFMVKALHLDQSPVKWCEAAKP